MGGGENTGCGLIIGALIAISLIISIVTSIVADINLLSLLW